jgi:hypothetical protein
MWFGAHTVARGFWPTLIAFGIAFAVLGLVVLAAWLIATDD